MEQLMFHVSFGTHGVLAGDRMLAIDSLREVILLPIAYAMIGVAVILLLGRSLSPALLRTSLASILFVFFLAGIARLIYRSAPTHVSAVQPLLSRALDCLVYQPGFFTFEAALAILGAAVVSTSLRPPSVATTLVLGVLSLRLWGGALIASVVYLLSFFPPSAYVEVVSNETAATYIDRNYVSPAYDAPSAPGDLVFIYVESLEASYRDIEGGKILEPLDRETREWPSLSSYTQVFGTGWTTAAVVATQCGLPLRPPVGNFAGRVNDDMSTRIAILGRATCLGDVLGAAGYQNVFLTGPSLSFGGLGEFIWSHGYGKTWGREEWMADGETEISEWGLTDDRLFARARAELDRLAAAEKPFNLTLLTVDNHGPNGILNDACHAAGASDFPGIVHCNSSLVADFIAYVRQHAPDAVIVVTGDHLAHDNPLIAELQALPQRHVYGKVLPPGSEPVWRTDVSHFDFFPSVLEMLGFTSPERRAGLGASFVGLPIQGFVNPLSTPGYDEELTAKSTLYTQMWKPE